MIKRDAAATVGVEISDEFIQGAADRGVELLKGDAESIRLGQKFDVVFAGELIEHLTCFSGLLETVRAHLKPEGRFILTTPNAFGISGFVYRLFGPARVHNEHTCWFCEQTLRQLLERADFDVVETRYLAHTTPGRLRRLLAGSIRMCLPERLALNTIMVIAVPRQS